MILSLHPCYAGDIFINCGGRRLTLDDIAVLKQAAAVILPQACKKELYETAIKYCPAVFPDFDKKFAFPGKTGQIRLFRQTGTPHPDTHIFADTADLHARAGDSGLPDGLAFPVVLKLDGTDEGQGVFLARTADELSGLIRLAARAEKTGEAGFIIQQYIETGGRVLRVCVIYKTILAYWRVSRDTTDFRVNSARGAEVDKESFSELRDKGAAAVRRFCDQTGINLAGFDLVFPLADKTGQPLFLEINYYFGRRGLGGSENYYNLLIREIHQWLTDQGKTGVRPDPARA